MPENETLESGASRRQTASSAPPPPRTKTALGCLMLAVPLLFFLGLMGSVIWWLGLHPPAALLRQNDAYLTWLDRQSTMAVEAVAIATPLVWVALCLLIVFLWMRITGERPGTSSRWIYFALSALVFAEIARLCIYLYNHKTYAEMSARHHTFITVMFRTDFVLALLILGLGLYAFKEQSKLLYGCAEIIFSVICNLKLIKDLDLSQWPRFTVQTPQIIAIAALTYVFSKGIANVVEGIAEDRKEATCATSPVPGSTAPTP
jgi:hypothetical protein